MGHGRPSVRSSPAGEGDGDDRHLFAGVRFVIVGFDSVSESQYWAEMVRCGGAEAGRLGGCTHVVACDHVYKHSRSPKLTDPLNGSDGKPEKQDTCSTAVPLSNTM